MKQKLIAFILTFGFVLMNPLALWAQTSEDPIYDGRLEGYSAGDVTLATKTPALMWMLLVVLAGLCLGVMFKNANRSHLD